MDGVVVIARIQHIARSIEIEGEGLSDSDSVDTTLARLLKIEGEGGSGSDSDSEDTTHS